MQTSPVVSYVLKVFFRDKDQRLFWPPSDKTALRSNANCEAPDEFVQQSAGSRSLLLVLYIQQGQNSV